MKAYFKTLEYISTPHQIEADSESFRKSHLRSKSLWAKLKLQRVQIDRNETAISNLQMDELSLAIIESYALSDARMEHRVRCSRIYIEFHRAPSFGDLEADRYKGKRPSFQTLIAKDNRHG